MPHAILNEGSRHCMSGQVPAVKGHYYSQHAAAFRAELGRAIPRERLRELHRKSAARHLAVAARQFGFLALGTWALVRVEQPARLDPARHRPGLHRIQLHGPAARGRAPRRLRAQPCLALNGCSACSTPCPSGISATQFTRWHLDHHAELGSDGGRSEAPPPVAEDQRPLVQAAVLHARPVSDLLPRGARERPRPTRLPSRRSSSGSDGCRSALTLRRWPRSRGGGGAAAALRAYIVPVFFVFPVAFTLNRLGQHYDIDPADPAKWTTLVRGNWFWNFAFLNSNFHLEHHYFPGVPFYNLPALQRLLVPVLRPTGHPVARLLGARVRLALPQQGPAHQLGQPRSAAARCVRAPSRHRSVRFVMDFRPTDQHELLRHTIREFAEAEIRPHVMEWDEGAALPVGAGAPPRRARPDGDPDSRGIRRRGDVGGGLLHLHRGTGARGSLRGAHRCGAQRPLHGAPVHVRDRSAEAAVRRPAGARRVDGRVGPDRTDGRQRRGRHADEGGAPERLLGAQRAQDLHHARPRGPGDGGHGGHGPRGRAPRDLRVRRRAWHGRA